MTVVGLGFTDLGATVSFISQADSEVAAYVPASIAVGTMRGRVLRCVSPVAAGAPGSYRIELSLNGDPSVNATVGSLLYTYE